MLTNFELHEELVEEAFRYSSVVTKWEFVNLAFREFGENHRRKDVREFRGKGLIRSDYLYKGLREGR